MIDIGGPTMIRSANHQSVTVIVDPADYARVIKEMKENNGDTTHATNLTLQEKYTNTQEYMTQ